MNHTVTAGKPVIVISVLKFKTYIVIVKHCQTAHCVSQSFCKCLFTRESKSISKCSSDSPFLRGVNIWHSCAINTFFTSGNRCRLSMSRELSLRYISSSADTELKECHDSTPSALVLQALAADVASNKAALAFILAESELIHLSLNCEMGH